ncbi:response regulator transcription factor [Ruminiclostridium sufflavum]|nr:response regulator transcription factor [Ruminiclostridium sufflavum]
MTNSSKKILVVDDEIKIVDVVRSYLHHNGYDVVEAYTGKQAVALFERFNPCLVILDLMLPDMTGEDICIQIRKKSKVPIIMLTAKVEEEHILKGLDIGADDYIIKPFSPRQLVARVNALLRRASEEPFPNNDIVSFNLNDLVINKLSMDVKKNGKSVSLTPNEYKILLTLIKHPKKAFTREELISMALGEDFDGYDRTIDSHVKNLRQKIETDTKNPEYILTVHGIGYRFGGD